jgi:hypothetical protein
VASPPAPLLERAGSAAARIGAPGGGTSRAATIARVCVVALVLAFLTAFVVTQWGRLPDYEWRFDPAWLALSAATVASFYVAQAAIWRRILRALGEQVPARPARAVYAKSLLARYVPTNVLMVVGRVVLAERHGVKRRVCLASMTYEVGLGFASAVIVGSYFVVTLPPLQDEPARFAILLAVPAALAGLHPRVFQPTADRLLRRLGREPLPRALPFARVLQFAALYAVTWATVGLGVFAFASALHPVDLDDVFYLSASYALGFCAAVLTFVVPAGLGGRDAALAAALAVPLPGAVATAIAVAFRLFQTAVELAFVGAGVALARRSPRTRS